MIKKRLWKLLGADEEIGRLTYELGFANRTLEHRAKRIDDLSKERDSLKTTLELEKMAAQHSGNRAMRIMESGTGDVEPTDQKSRADYVASASNFYTDILEGKLMQMIAQSREALDTVFQEVPPGMDRMRYDDFLRGTSNAFKLLTEWGERMKGEHQANIIQEGNK